MVVVYYEKGSPGVVGIVLLYNYCCMTHDAIVTPKHGRHLDHVSGLYLIPAAGGPITCGRFDYMQLSTKQ